MRSMILISLFALLAFVSSDKCEKWQCGRASKGYCWDTDYSDPSNYSSTKIRTLGQWCNNGYDECTLLQWSDSNYRQGCHNPFPRPSRASRGWTPPSYYPEKQQKPMMRRLCHENLYEVLGCQDICRETLRYGRHCDLKKFSMSGGKSGGSSLLQASAWADCTSDDQCLSGKCSCGPNLDGKGRCETSFTDRNLYKSLAQKVCYNPYWVRSEYTEETCLLWLKIKYGHFMKSMLDLERFNPVPLPCLYNYNDAMIMSKAWRIEELDEDKLQYSIGFIDKDLNFTTDLELQSVTTKDEAILMQEVQAMSTNGIIDVAYGILAVVGLAVIIGFAIWSKESKRNRKGDGDMLMYKYT